MRIANLCADWINALLALYQRQTETVSTAGTSDEPTLKALRR
jgi:hypothetical protein